MAQGRAHGAGAGGGKSARGGKRPYAGGAGKSTATGTGKSAGGGGAAGGRDGDGEFWGGDTAENQAELAAYHKVTQQAVSKWIHDPRWSAAGFAARGPWKLAELQRQAIWRRDVLQEDRSGDGAAAMEGGIEKGKLDFATKVARLNLLVAKKQVLDQQMAIAGGKYVKREEAEEERVKKMLAIKEGLMRVPPALRQLLADTTDPAEVERILEASLRAVCVEGLA